MLIDTHAHIYLDHFDEDFTQVIHRAKIAGVSHILMPNIDENSINRVINRAAEYSDFCYPMVGLHPCSVTPEWKSQIEKLNQFIDSPRIVAIGEIGIDLYWDQSLSKEQIEAFEYQISQALELDLPIVIHSRSAIDLTISSVQKFQNGNLKGVFHCFDQSLEHAKAIIDAGFYIGIGGIITYKKNQELRNTLKAVPLESIILETDSPYLPPEPHRGKRNESSYVKIVAEKLAEIREITFEEVEEATSNNAKRLFSLTD